MDRMRVDPPLIAKNWRNAAIAVLSSVQMRHLRAGILPPASLI